MKNNLKNYLEKEIKNFFNKEITFQYIEKNQSFDNNVIDLQLEEIENNTEKNNFLYSSVMRIRLEIIEDQKLICIPNIIFKGKFEKKGLGKKVIKLVYEIGKRNGYKTILYDMVNSFFDSMRRRNAKVINIEKQNVEITDKTDLESKRTVPKPFTPEILKYSETKKVKKEFLPFNSNQGIESILFNYKRVEELLSDIEFDEIKDKSENLILIPMMDLKYILETYFDSNDPFGLDKELCELFYFVIHKNNSIIPVLEKIETEYVILKNDNTKEFCTFSENYYTGYKILTFKNKKELKNKMGNLPQKLINILYFAKLNNKLSFSIGKLKI